MDTVGSIPWLPGSDLPCLLGRITPVGSLGVLRQSHAQAFVVRLFRACRVERSAGGQQRRGLVPFPPIPCPHARRGKSVTEHKSLITLCYLGRLTGAACSAGGTLRVGEWCGGKRRREETKQFPELLLILFSFPTSRRKRATMLEHGLCT